MRSRRLRLLSVVLAVLSFQALPGIGLVDTIRADTGRSLQYIWGKTVWQPGGALYYYKGNYFSESRWYTYYGTTNFFTRHESVVVVDNPTSDITAPGTVLYFYWNGTQKIVVPRWAWNRCCYIIQPDDLLFGGNTTDPAYLGGFSNNVSGQDRGTWAFQLCDAAGCYGGVGDDRRWTLW